VEAVSRGTLSRSRADPAVRPWVDALRTGHVDRDTERSRPPTLRGGPSSRAFSPSWVFAATGPSGPRWTTASSSRAWRSSSGILPCATGTADPRGSTLGRRDESPPPAVRRRRHSMATPRWWGPPARKTWPARQSCAATLEDLARDQRLDELRLAPLLEGRDAHAVRTLAPAASSGGVMTGFAEQVWVLSEGNPFAVARACARFLRTPAAIHRRSSRSPSGSARRSSVTRSAQRA